MIFSPKRKTDPRDNWEQVGNRNDDGLSIPPCDLWHNPDSVSGNVSADIAVPNDKAPNIKELEPRPQGFSGYVKPQCWAFMGTVGGVGTTALAVQLAFELAKTQRPSKSRSRRVSSPEVCLVDLDFETGRCAHQMDIHPSLSIEDLNTDAMQIDAAFTESLMTHHESGVDVLAAPNMIGANAKIKTQTVLALLDEICNRYAYVILDVPSHWKEWSFAALGGADFIGLVTNSTIPSLHVTRTKHAQLKEMYENEDKSFEIILNRYERRSLKKNLSLKDVQSALHRNIYGTICNDPDVLREALNCGSPIGEIRPDSRYAKDSRKLLSSILASVQENNQETLPHLMTAR